MKQSVDMALIVAAVTQRGFPEPVREHTFLPDRKFRFDLAWPAAMVAFEREGNTWQKSRHTTGRGYRDDCEKYSLAAVAGWCVVRATVDMIESGLALTLLLNALESRPCKTHLPSPTPNSPPSPAAGTGRRPKNCWAGTRGLSVRSCGPPASP